MGRTTSHYDTGAFVQAHANVAGDVTLSALNISVQVLTMGREPETVVDYVGILLSDAGLGAALVFAESHGFQGLVSGVEHHGCGGLVDFPGLDAHQPILHMV